MKKITLFAIAAISLSSMQAFSAGCPNLTGLTCANGDSYSPRWVNQTWKVFKGCTACLASENRCGSTAEDFLKWCADRGSTASVDSTKKLEKGQEQAWWSLVKQLGLTAITAAV